MFAGVKGIVAVLFTFTLLFLGYLWFTQPSESGKQTGATGTIGTDAPTTSGETQPGEVTGAGRGGYTLAFTQLKGGVAVTVPAKREKPVAPIASLAKADSLSPYEQELSNAIGLLLQGPTAAEQAEGVYTEIPAGTKLLSIDDTDEVLKVNLTQPFAVGAGAHSVIQRVEELKATIRPLTKDKKVLLLIEGKPATTIGSEGLEIDNPFVITEDS